MLAKWSRFVTSNLEKAFFAWGLTVARHPFPVMIQPIIIIILIINLIKIITIIIIINLIKIIITFRASKSSSETWLWLSPLHLVVIIIVIVIVIVIVTSTMIVVPPGHSWLSHPLCHIQPWSAQAQNGTSGERPPTRLLDPGNYYFSLSLLTLRTNCLFLETRYWW